MKFIRRIIYKYIKPWFFSNEDPSRIKVPYVISFIFITLTIFSIIIHVSIKCWQFTVIRRIWKDNGVQGIGAMLDAAKMDLSLVPLISVLIGTAGMFIGLYNWGKKKHVPEAAAPVPEGASRGDGGFGKDEV